jgi:ADP-heptose:LPS heptosyltransferase
MGGLGDIIMSTPIARGAKRKYPKCHVTYSVNFEYANGQLVSLLENIPYIDEIADYTIINRNDYDVFADITRAGLGEERPFTVPRNRIDLFAQAAGFPLFGEGTPIYVMTEDEEAWGKEYVEKHSRGRSGNIALHIKSNDARRTWPTRNNVDFIKQAHKNGYHCFLIDHGLKADEWRFNGSTVAFNFSMRETAAIINACDVVVCPDSVMLHLAGALNKKIVTVFGPIPPASRISYYPNAVAVVNQNISCLGCWYAQCNAPRTIEGWHYCMSSVTPETVLEAVNQRMGSDLLLPDYNDGDRIYSGNVVKKTINTFSI